MCGNFCKKHSKICSACVTLWLAEKELRQKEWEEKQLEYEKKKLEKEALQLQRDIRKCEGYRCTEMTKFKFCRQCNEVNKQYIFSNKDSHLNEKPFEHESYSPVPVAKPHSGRIEPFLLSRNPIRETNIPPGFEHVKTSNETYPQKLIRRKL
jgi:hypothetical protein